MSSFRIAAHLCAASLLTLTAGCQTTKASSTDATSSPQEAETMTTETTKEPQSSHGDGHAHGGAHGGAHGEGHDLGHGAHRGDHFADPERFVPAWNAPERDAWQKPEEILAAMGIEPGDTVVDLGAGTGYLIPKLSEAVGPEGTVIAADIEPAMLRFLEDAAKEEGWTNVRTLASAPDDPKLAPNSVDAIVTLNVWHHVGGREAYAKKLARALKPGGVFVVVDFLKEETEGFGPPLAMRLTAEQVTRELSAGGLSASVVEETLPRHYIVVGQKAGADTGAVPPAAE